MVATQESKTTTADPVVEYTALKERQRLAWQTGDYPRVGIMMQLIAERLVKVGDFPSSFPRSREVCR
jgi:hypothetical protein